MNSKFSLKNILCLVLVLLYFLGLVLMITGRLGQGIACWTVSTVGGAIALGLMHRAEERAQRAAEAAKNTEDSGENKA